MDCIEEIERSGSNGVFLENKTKNHRNAFFKRLTGRFFKSSIIGILLVLIQMCFSVSAQTSYHASVSANCELFSARCGGADFTFLYDRSWGLRYTKVPDLDYLKTDEFSNELNTLSYSGDFLMPMLLRTLDFRSFNGQSKTMFDFITAYIGVGSNELSLEMEKNRFYAKNGLLQKETTFTKVTAPTHAVAFGFYGGERFLVLDWRLLYARGELEANSLIDKKYSFSLWMIIFSLGFGF